MIIRRTILYCQYDKWSLFRPCDVTVGVRPWNAKCVYTPALNERRMWNYAFVYRYACHILILIKFLLISNINRVTKSPHFLFYYSFHNHWPISIIFGTYYTEKICNITVIDFPTSPGYCCYTTSGISSVLLDYSVELFAADCSWFVTDSNTVLYEAKDISVYSSLQDITNHHSASVTA